MDRHLTIERFVKACGSEQKKSIKGWLTGWLHTTLCQSMRKNLALHGGVPSLETTAVTFRSTSCRRKNGCYFAHEGEPNTGVTGWPQRTRGQTGSKSASASSSPSYFAVFVCLVRSYGQPSSSPAPKDSNWGRFRDSKACSVMHSEIMVLGTTCFVLRCDLLRQTFSELHVITDPPGKKR